MKTQQWGFPYGGINVYVDATPGHARNKFILIGDKLNHVAYIPAIHPEAKEIAFLVKAAPDLLAALEQIAQGPDEFEHSADIWEELEACRMVARRAIAKARGGA